MKYRVAIYRTKRGKEPFRAWLGSLKDKTAERLIVRRIGRLREGHFGDCKTIKGDSLLRELRVAYGPGYRVYFAKLRGAVCLLLLGGTKRTQERDIGKAKAYLQDHKEAI